MKHYKIKRILTVTVFLFSVVGLFAQQKLNKISKSVNANKDVTIHLNTNYTNIEIDTWNKDVVEIEAYIESDKLSNEELKTLLNSWKINIEGSGDAITIKSGGSIHGDWDGNMHLFGVESIDALKDLEIELANLPKMPLLEGLMESINLAEMPKLPNMPNLPDLPEGMNNVDFDYDKYKEEGESYMEKWSKEYGEKFGEDYAKKMEAWAQELDNVDFKAYEKEMEAWGEKMGKEFEIKFGKDFEMKMEAWGEEFGKVFEEKYGKRMEEWGEQFGAQMEEQAKILEERLKENEGLFEENESNYKALFESHNSSNQKVKKTIKIKMPKKAKLKMNVRHGELKIASVIHNLKADMSHSAFSANSIDGGGTSINASYSSVLVNTWNSGELNLNYVEDALLKQVNELVLNSNSSDINIENMLGNGIIDGSFGELKIHNISDSFNNLNIVLENSDATIQLPKSDYNLFFKGNRSRFNNENTSNKTIKNHPNGNSTNKTIVINAKYSDIIAR